eukprot:TRINITY_DN5069_c0_g1_i6.p2 TRINITY_DN5069_c0_g1~~TRINITY_DN5069_c0_g1_i6.p2  ORF type:complete len:306 (+),score=108.31 TRINITY_DN5069_c0_g1_i6:312-1229(+)
MQMFAQMPAMAGGQQLAYPANTQGAIFMDPSGGGGATQPMISTAGMQPQQYIMPGQVGGQMIMPQQFLQYPGVGGVGQQSGAQTFMVQGPGGQMVPQQFMFMQQQPQYMLGPQGQLMMQPQQQQAQMPQQTQAQLFGMQQFQQPQLQQQMQMQPQQQTQQFQIQCPQCSQSSLVPPELAGMQFNCPHCSTRLALQQPATQQQQILPQAQGQQPAGVQGAVSQLGITAPGVQVPQQPAPQQPAGAVGAAQPATTSASANGPQPGGQESPANGAQCTHQCPSCSGMFRATKNQGHVTCPVCSIRLIV